MGGFALLLIGIGLMQSISPAIHDSEFFKIFLSRADDSVLWGIAAGIVLSAAMHSSAAVISIIMGLAAAGVMPVEIGIAVVLGANVGTCITTVLAAIGGTRSGRLVKLVACGIECWRCHSIRSICCRDYQTVSAWITASPSGQIAHAQTLFNIISSLIALPICYYPKLRNLRLD